MTHTIHVRGSLMQVSQTVAKLPDTIYMSALEVLKERIALFVGLAKINAPVDTGSLRDSIRSQWIGVGRHVARVTAGGYVTNPRTGRLVDYAAYVEANQPFMRPAWEEVKPDIEDMIAARMVERVE